MMYMVFVVIYQQINAAYTRFILNNKGICCIKTTIYRSEGVRDVEIKKYLKFKKKPMIVSNHRLLNIVNDFLSL